MKKIICLTLVLVMMLALLASCTGQTGGPNETKGKDAATTEAAGEGTTAGDAGEVTTAEETTAAETASPDPENDSFWTDNF